MSVHVLGEAVVGDVGAQLEGPLEVGGLEGVVHHEEEVLVLLHHVRHGLDVHHLPYIRSSISADDSDFYLFLGCPPPAVRASEVVIQLTRVDL